MKFIDTHAHLDGFGRRGGLAEIVGRAMDAGVEKIVACSTNPDEWLFYESAAREFAGSVFWQIGIHPGDISENCEIALDSLGAFFASEFPPVAIGEIGLDYFRAPSDPAEFEAMRDRQIKIFSRQLELSNSFESAKICVHARDSVGDCVEQIAAAGVDFSRVVFHCYAGTAEELAEINALGARASFTGIITYKSAGEMRRAMLAQGLGRLMLETDCPYLAPAPLCGSVNEPANIPLIARAAAEIFGVSEEYLADAVRENSRGFFGI